MSNPTRPKVRAAGQAAAVGAPSIALLVWLAGLVNIDVASVPPEVLVLLGGWATGTLATLAAYLKRDGLKGAWERIVNGSAR